MEKSGSHGDAKGKVPRIPETEEAKAKTAAEGTEAGFRAKRGGGLIPAKRRLVKRMMWDYVVTCICFCGSPTYPEPVLAKNTTVGVARVLPLPGKRQRR
ncbi:uncharacterized protein J3R85_014315 [Psidium guajava]|nr:uncharacterized protein J3R85_014315 [Psidium guajava]